MRKGIKKILATATAAVLTLGSLSLAACGASFNTPTGIPEGASSNGGFVVSVGEYYYFINGVETYTSDNTYGVPVKGALMRAKKSELGTSEIVVPSLMVAGDYTAGIFVFGDRVYYATPNNVRNTTGVVGNTLLDFKSAKLDGTDIKDIYRIDNNSTVFRFVQVEGSQTVYLLYAESQGSSSYTLHSFNTAEGKDTVLASGVTQYLLSSDEKDDPYIYYTMNVVDKADSDGAQTQPYNQIYRVRADATEIPDGYAYKDESFWDMEYLNEHSMEIPYVNLGEIVLDGRGSLYPVTGFNHSTSDPISSIGFSYTLQSYKNGGIYFSLTETSTSEGLFYLSAEKLGAGWDSVKGNDHGANGSLTCIAGNDDATNKATSAAYFYLDETGKHHYIYSKDSALYRVDIDAEGKITEDLQIAHDVGSATIVGIDMTSDPDYDYVYFTRTNSSGLSVERAVFNGEEENYKNLTYTDENGNEQDNAAYRSVKVLDLQHASNWYNYEIVDNVVFYADAESFGGTSYNYVSCVDLKNAEGKLMNNVELGEFNDLYASITDTSDKTKGLFAKLNDLFGDSDLSNAIKYYFYTGESKQFNENVQEALDYDQKITSLYTEEEQKAFNAFTQNEKYELDGTVVFDRDDFMQGEKSYRTYDYFRTRLGQMNESDTEALQTYWKTSGLNYYTPPAEEESGLAWWAWLLIAIAIVVVVAGVAMVLCAAYLYEKNKKTEEPVKRRKVDTTDNRDIDVYADEPEETAEETEETSEEAAEETEETAEEETAEETVEETSEEAAEEAEETAEEGSEEQTPQE